MAGLWVRGERGKRRSGLYLKIITENYMYLEIIKIYIYTSYFIERNFGEVKGYYKRNFRNI